MFGTSNFPTHVTKVVHAYKTGDLLHATTYPRHLEVLKGGLILDLPQVNVQEYLQRKLALEHFLDDEYLTSFLQ